MAFLPVPTLLACLLCTPFLTSLHVNNGPSSGGEKHSWLHMRLLFHRMLGLSCQDLSKKTLVTQLEVGRTLLSHDEARFLLFSENVHVNGKTRLEGLGTEPKLVWRVRFLSCHRYR